MSRIRDIQMHGIVLAPDSSGGPGTPKFELDADWLNVTWQQNLNMAGQAAFSLLRHSPLLPLIDFNRDHIHLYRECSAGVSPVFTGKINRPDVGVRDTVCWCVDYKGYFAKSRSGWMTLYPSKLIGSEIVSPEFDIAKAADNSVLAFLTKGTIEDPLGDDGITAMKTNEEFGLTMQDRLMLFYMLAELAMANTEHNVVWEVTRSAPFTFNFWKDRTVNRTAWAATHPGTLADFAGDMGSGDQTNDIATPMDDGSGTSSFYQAESAASIASYRRLQQAVSLRTLVGITTTTVETDQAKAAMQRMLAEALLPVGLVAAYPRQGDLDPFIGWDVGDSFRHTYQNAAGGDLFDGYLRTVSYAASWAPDKGELAVLYARSPS